MTTKVVSLALLAPIIFSLLFVLGRGEQCGRQAGGKACPGYRCCSHWGWCGDTLEYCGDGCQSDCSFYWRCGRQVSGRVCPGGRCCSSSGWCGDTTPYCGKGCQSNCWRVNNNNAFDWVSFITGLLPSNVTDEST